VDQRAEQRGHLILGNSKTEDRRPPMVVNTTDTPIAKSRQPPPHERGERKRSKPALNGAFGLSGFFSPKGVVLLQLFFFVDVTLPDLNLHYFEFVVSKLARD